ncbi:MAG: phenylacetate--CoA ligase family protein [Nitrososphaerota archaeon]|nr:phenylacetate--CoA ligase family protein [Nitrososphaerota archaeon]
MITREREYWESERNINYITWPSKERQIDLRNYFDARIYDVMQHPFLSSTQIEQLKIKRIRELVKLAYERIPMYREKYDRAGVSPDDIHDLIDFSYFPIITKNDLISAFPKECVDLKRFRQEELFRTRSSGSSGQVVRLYADLKAILADTIQGVRQFYLQSGRKYAKDHKTALIYTCPWWFSSIGEDYQTYFISSLLASEEIARILHEIKPSIISCYPSILNELLPKILDLDSIYLIVVHSEQSSALEREDWSRKLRVPVLDEYSSEEATRIALQFPCGHYHVCEDTVHLEVLHPQTLRPRPAGESGWVAVTNLLNEAMPVIRYLQGDYAVLGEEQETCYIGWKQVKSIDGRVNDSFINLSGKQINSGALLDLTYRWMMETEVGIRNFQMIQRYYDEVDIVIQPKSDEERIYPPLNMLKSWLEMLLGHEVKLTLKLTKELINDSVKRRPIKRDFRYDLTSDVKSANEFLLAARNAT